MPDEPADIEIEVTPEMVEAGAAVITAGPFCDLGSGYCEIVAKRVVEAALRVLGGENCLAA